jgi:hypothetical protein
MNAPAVTAAPIRKALAARVVFIREDIITALAVRE